MTGGSRDYSQPAFSYGGRTGAIDYFVTGQFLHNGIGIENPTASFTPHPRRHRPVVRAGQDHRHHRRATRASASSPAAPARVSRSPTSPSRRRTSPSTAKPTSTARFSTSASGRRATSASPRCRRTTRTLDFQLSGFARYSSLSYQPDPFGDLMFNGIAPWTSRNSFATGVQGDGTWKVARRPHAARRLPGAARARHQLHQRQHPAAGAERSRPIRPAIWSPPTSPLGFTDGSDLIGWTYSVYLQDEWRVVPTVTVNFGLRFDAINGATQENQLSPRINVVWQPSTTFTGACRLLALLHAAAAHPGQRQLDRDSGRHGRRARSDARTIR